MKQFKIRASGAGDLSAGTIGISEKQVQTLAAFDTKVVSGKALTSLQQVSYNDIIAKRDNPELPAGAKSYLQTWVKEQLYQRRNEFSSKYTDKGNIMEQDALDFVAKLMKLGMLIKNEESFENDHFTGTPDSILKDYIIDVKCSWDPFTFPLMETEVPNSSYYYQAQVYMDLVGRDSYKLIYCLMDTPQHLIEKEATWKARNDGYDTLPDSMLQDFLDNMTYGDIDDKYRIKVFEIERDQKAIDDMKKRVEMSREYIKELQKIDFNITKL